jgi:prepilin-type N-terminal cleavage/methylation domain-containing protein
MSTIKKRGFTLIEVILSVVLIAIIVPAGVVALSNLSHTVGFYQRVSQAINIAKDQMSIVNRLPFNDPTLANGKNIVSQNYQNSSFNVTRTVNNVFGNDNNAEVLKRIMVKVQDTMTNVSFTLYTLRAKNVVFGPPSQGGVSGQAVNLNLTEGGAALSNKTFQSFGIENISQADPITIDKMRVVWDPIVPNQVLNSVLLRGNIVFNGNEPSGNLIDIANVAIPPTSSTNSNKLIYSKNFVPQTDYTFTLIFQMTDASQRSITITKTAL